MSAALPVIPQSRCSGECCTGFTLNWPLWYLDLTGDASYDTEAIVEMCVPLPMEDGKLRYSCRHLQSNGDCGIYDRRPEMCRRYPLDGFCSAPGCTLSSVNDPALKFLSDPAMSVDLDERSLACSPRS